MGNKLKISFKEKERWIVISLMCLDVLEWAWCVLDSVGQVSMALSVLDGMGRKMKHMR